MAGGGRLLLLLLLLLSSVCWLADAQGRQRGTLLLNMLIKNEAEHLRRSLPKWAPLIDYWIIGVDDHNTDESEDVIRQYLGHIPGEIVVVAFDGMGPTWTKLVERGLEAFPNATHGIIADADFTPMQSSLDKSQLILECSKHMYRIRSTDGSTVRNMDWIYRNIPGAKVERRTHQSLSVPKIPGQRVFQTMIDLEVQEFTGGYQDRSGNKSQRYLNWLLKDLEEMPNDPRTIYYLGHAHLDMIGPTPAQDVQSGGAGAEHVKKALEYFTWRSEVRMGYFEERWFAMLKAAEICERYLFDYECSLRMWNKAKELDPERVDTYFYIGQHYRLAQQPDLAFPYLEQAVKLQYPPRSLFQWNMLYDCLRHLELGRVAMAATKMDRAKWRVTKKSLKTALRQCPREHQDEVGRLLGTARQELNKYKKSKEPAQQPPAAAAPDQKAADPSKDAPAGDTTAPSRSGAAKPYVVALERLQDWHGTHRERLDKVQLGGELEAITASMSKVVAAPPAAVKNCKEFIETTQGYLSSFNSNMEKLRSLLWKSEPQLWVS